RFSSGILQEAMHATLPRRRRRALHWRWAELLEARHAGRPERVLPQLVHHWSEADEPLKVVAHGTELARRSLAACSPTEALRAASRVLEFLEEGERVAEAGARELLAAAHRQAGATEACLRELERAVALYTEA